MKVELVAVSREESGFRVQFECGSGVGIASWMGRTAPRVGQQMNVEIDIEDAISFPETARTSDRYEYKVSHRDGDVTFEGVVEDQDDDGMSYFRVSVDCLLMLDSAEEDLKGQWLELNVSVNSVKMTPIGG